MNPLKELSAEIGEIANKLTALYPRVPANVLGRVLYSLGTARGVLIIAKLEPEPDPAGSSDAKGTQK